MSPRPVSNPPQNPLPSFEETAPVSPPVTVAIADCLPSVPNAGCVISSRDGYLDRSDSVNMFNGSLVDAPYFPRLQAYLQSRTGWSGPQGLPLLPAATFFQELDLARRAIEQSQSGEALARLQRAGRIEEDHFHNPVAGGQIRTMLMEILAPAIQAAGALEASRNPSTATIGAVLNGPLFHHAAEIARFGRDNFLEAPVVERIGRLRQSTVNVGFRVLTSQARALLRQRRPKIEDLTATSDFLHALVQQAGNFRIPFDEPGVVLLTDRLDRGLPPRRPPLEM